MITKTQRKNCAKLADILERVPDSEFAMIRWIRKNDCGTTGCALGWAAMSGEFDGLQWCAYRYTTSGARQFARSVKAVKPSFTVAPVVDGKLEDWEETGRKFFGRETMYEVFFELHASKEKVLDDLRALARRGEL